MIHYCFLNNNPNTTSKTFLYYTKFLSLCLFLCLHTPPGPVCQVGTQEHFRYLKVLMCTRCCDITMLRRNSLKLPFVLASLAFSIITLPGSYL